MKKYIRTIETATILVMLLLCGFYGHTQQIKTLGNIRSDMMGTNPFVDASSFSSSGYDISLGKGLAFPETDLTQWEFVLDMVDDLNTPTFYDGMIVFNTATGQTKSGQGEQVYVRPGFYYFSNPSGSNTEKISKGKWVVFNNIMVGNGDPRTSTPAVMGQGGDIYLDKDNGDLYTWDKTAGTNGGWTIYAGKQDLSASFNASTGKLSLGLTDDPDTSNNAELDLSGLRDGDAWGVAGENTTSAIGRTGNVGIGTTAPTAKFHVDAAEASVPSKGLVRLGDKDYSSQTNNVLLSVAPGVVEVDAPGIKGGRFKIDDTGNVGIGITAPVSKFHVYENTTSTNDTAGLTIEQDGTGDAITQYLLKGDQRWVTGIDNSDANKFKWASSTDLNTDALMTLTEGGNVGIGTTAPTAKFHVDAAAASVPSKGLVRLGDKDYSSQTNNVLLSVAPGVVEVDAPGIKGGRFKIDDTGNVGIGVNDPSEKLHINGGESTTVAISDNANTGNNLGLAMYHGGASGKGMGLTWNDVINSNVGGLIVQTINNTGGFVSNHTTFTRDGNLGIGVTAPTKKLDVNGEARIRTLTTGAATDQVVVAGTDGVLKKVASSSVGSDDQTLSLSAVDQSGGEDRTGYQLKIESGNTVYFNDNDNQKISVFSINNSTNELSLDIEGDNEDSKTVSLNHLRNTDNQQVQAFLVDTSRDELTLEVERGGGKKSIPLTTLRNTINSDNQKLSVPTPTDDTKVDIVLEDGGSVTLKEGNNIQLSQTRGTNEIVIEATASGGGTNTDNQNLSVNTATANNPVLQIERGNDVTFRAGTNVNLAATGNSITINAQNTNTDNQQISAMSMSGDRLSLSLTRGNTRDVDLSGLRAKVQAGSGVSVSGLGTTASPYTISANGGSGTSDGDAWGVNGEDKSSNINRTGNVTIGLTKSVNPSILEPNKLVVNGNIQLGGAIPNHQAVIGRIFVPGSSTPDTGWVGLSSAAYQNSMSSNYGTSTGGYFLNNQGALRAAAASSQEMVLEGNLINAFVNEKMAIMGNQSRDLNVDFVSNGTNTNGSYRKATLNLLNDYGTSYMQGKKVGFFIETSTYVIGNDKQNVMQLGRYKSSPINDQLPMLLLGKNGIVMTNNSSVTYPGTGGFALRLHGSAWKSDGSSSWSTGSDRRIKDNIAPYHKGLAEVLKINPVTFTYNEKAGVEDTTKEHVGIVAQDIEKVFPNTVTAADDTAGPSGLKDKRNFDNSELLYTLINAVKELKAENDALKERIEALEDK